MEFRFIFSQYSSTIGSFIYPGTENELVQKSSDTYLIGRNFQLKYTHSSLLPYVDDDINPIGNEITLQYNYEMNKFNPESNYEVEDGILKPLYDNFNFHRVELNWKMHVGLWKGHTINSTFRAGSILGPAQPDFFDFYLAVLRLECKFISFYALSGNEVGWLNLT